MSSFPPFFDFRPLLSFFLFSYTGQNLKPVLILENNERRHTCVFNYIASFNYDDSILQMLFVKLH